MQTTTDPVLRLNIGWADNISDSRMDDGFCWTVTVDEVIEIGKFVVDVDKEMVEEVVAESIGGGLPLNN